MTWLCQIKDQGVKINHKKHIHFCLNENSKKNSFFFLFLIYFIFNCVIAHMCVCSGESKVSMETKDWN